MLKRPILKHSIVLAFGACVVLVAFLAAAPAPKAHAASLTTPKGADGLVRASTIHPNSCGNTVTLSPGTLWLPGEAIVANTCSGQEVELIFQTDNNFVLYIGGRAQWASNTYKFARPDYAEFQPDGNLVVYSIDVNGVTVPTWASGTDNRGATNLDIQSDGNVVIYKNFSSFPSDAIWATNTCCH